MQIKDGLLHAAHCNSVLLEGKIAEMYGVSYECYLMLLIFFLLLKLRNLDIWNK